MNLTDLQFKANEIRKDIIKMLSEAGSGHSAGPLGMADIFTALYFGGILRYDPNNPDWGERDRLILSNGHICPVLHATLAHAGFFPIKELSTLRKLGSRLQGHPERERLPGVETTSGPLGSGLAQAAGLSYASRMDGKNFRVYCLTSDGEHDEGNHWEAVLFAGKNKLSNLTVFVDRNNIQISGFTEDVMPLEPLKEKYKAFGWNVLEIDGHDFEQIENADHSAKECIDKPTVVIAKTIPGKGVSFMEGKWEWHGKVPNEEEAKIALKGLEEIQNNIKSKT
ncbi:MAG: Transketolase domain protein [Candidatus Curtissbacteria bacterium GW2011_GWA1_40_16]|uniref:Transketolase domain protein n=1 Tax=Candidatus Curtissbacteria bacterium GW2011_GWA1_40_16 TaxID=1618405 RepID=A0A0G0TS14_9BACT|nr:MAG: Transketolase domain protein [Candidatus Curtissbacteria bacterium GW2011_GWA1_40_16]